MISFEFDIVVRVSGFGWISDSSNLILLLLLLSVDIVDIVALGLMYDLGLFAAPSRVLHLEFSKNFANSLVAFLIIKSPRSKVFPTLQY